MAQNVPAAVHVWVSGLLICSSFGSGVAKAKVAMGIDWMNRDGLRESIPPAYTEYIGEILMEEVLNRKELAA